MSIDGHFVVYELINRSSLSKRDIVWRGIVVYLFVFSKCSFVCKFKNLQRINFNVNMMVTFYSICSQLELYRPYFIGHLSTCHHVVVLRKTPGHTTEHCARRIPSLWLGPGLNQNTQIRDSWSWWERSTWHFLACRLWHGISNQFVLSAVMCLDPVSGCVKWEPKHWLKEEMDLFWRFP